MKKFMGFLAIILLNALLLTGCGGGGGGGDSAAPESTSKGITSFKITSTDPASIGTFGPDTITVIVPYGTDVRDLETDIDISGSSVSPASGEQQDFSSPVVYTVTAADGSTKTYTVTVIVAANAAKDISSFTIQNTDPQSLGVVGSNTIAVTVPYNTDVTSLVPEISITGVSISPASLEPVNFTNPVVYTVTAANGTTKNYTVTVTISPSPAKDITKFTLCGIDGYAEPDNTIGITVPYNTDITSLMPVISITGVSVSPASLEPVNFTNPVVYTVTAANGTTKNYTVTVTKAPSPAKDITKFTINGRDGIIKESNRTIELTLPFDTNVTSLTPQIVITGESVSPASGVPQDFSSPVVYRVRAFNGSTKDYTVSVTVEDEVLAFSADGISFNMVYVRGENNFPVLIDDSGRASVSSYRIGETEVTWALWLKVYSWSIANGYAFANTGLMGGGAGPFTDQHPVTQISWRDAIVWANAATEWYNAIKGTSYTPVYIYGDSIIIRDSRNATACDNAVARAANGFRLLTGNEWELAARLRNDPTNTVEGFDHPWFTKGDSASGATANHLNAAATGAVAVFSPSGSTAEIKSKLPNALGLYDMSGNVWEWCFELNGLDRFVKGGSYLSNSEYMRIGEVLTLPSNDTDSDRKLGLRLAKSE